ncbi:MAG: hypothetical protein ACOC0B_02330 [bacterium]
MVRIWCAMAMDSDSSPYPRRVPREQRQSPQPFRHHVALLNALEHCMIALQFKRDLRPRGNSQGFTNRLSPAGAGTALTPGFRPPALVACDSLTPA